MMTTLELLSDMQRATHIPLSYYKGNQLLLRKPDLPYMDKLTEHAPELKDISNDSIRLITTEELIVYGQLRLGDTDERILFGPVSALECDNRKAQRILSRYGLPATDAGNVINYFFSIQPCSLYRFASFMRFANYVFNHEETDLMALLPNDYQYQDEPLPAHGKAVPIPHDAQEHERYMYSLIRFGRVAEMNAFIQSSPFTGNIGQLATTVSRHYKNLLVASATLAARSAVGGGLDYETAMMTADTFIQKVELTTTMQAMFNLHRNMLKNYTALVARAQQNKAESALVAKVYAYVSEHISGSVNVETVAAGLSINRSYLSAQFKKDTGINLNSYINQQKIDEACRILLTSDQSAVAIAETLGFSSQSQFNAVFKRITGKTPQEYRKQQSMFEGHGTNIQTNLPFKQHI